MKYMGKTEADMRQTTYDPLFATSLHLTSIKFPLLTHY